MRIILVVGARPNFMKIAPLMDAFEECAEIQVNLVHTGQHYDRAMSELFFRQLRIREPDVNLGVGSATHAVQTAEIMRAFEQVVIELKPDAVLVVGDVNSTIACGLVAVKLGVKLIHVEAGLRSFDRTMPEEINRVLTDAISDLLFCTEPSGVQNLMREGVSEEKIHFVGNVMIDTLLRHREQAEESTILMNLGIQGQPYAVVTLHRPSNVDDSRLLSRIMLALEEIGQEMIVIFPVHPRTKAAFKEGSVSLFKKQTKRGAKIRPHRSDSSLPDVILDHDSLQKNRGLRLIDPLSYLDFLKLMAQAKVVLTDSGGIQEETTILKVPCLTLRENTERPVTVELGTNRLVGTSPERILQGWREVVKDGFMKNGNTSALQTPPLWDGLAAKRIVDIIKIKDY